VLSDRQIESYRRMTPEERWRIVEELSASAWEALLELPWEERERRLALAREEHRLSNDAMLRRMNGRP
jgi:hypothetical protein